MCTELRAFCWIWWDHLKGTPRARPQPPVAQSHGEWKEELLMNSCEVQQFGGACAIAQNCPRETGHSMGGLCGGCRNPREAASRVGGQLPNWRGKSMLLTSLHQWCPKKKPEHMLMGQEGRSSRQEMGPEKPTLKEHRQKTQRSYCTQFSCCTGRQPRDPCRLLPGRRALTQSRRARRKMGSG